VEARAEHPAAIRIVIIGIDLGTTNCALASTTGRQSVRIFNVPQRVAAGEDGRLPTLPSFLLRHDNGREFIAGAFARDEGALTPARLIGSAKSWLANPRVDRTAPLLPWTPEGGSAADGQKLSPVEASARLLIHLRDGWNREHPNANDHLERQHIVLTVPASFDEEARELTSEAARLAGFERFTLLEEPLAALYAWIAAHRRHLTQALGEGRLILVCDVGGGTTDFSLIRATVAADDLGFERIAIGEHLLLGGDNLDLALAAVAESKLGGAKLTLVQRQVLRRRCAAAKERLLSDPSLEREAITILGSGRGVVGGGMTTELTANDVRQVLDDGFLPLTPAHDLPARDRRIGLRELGLPYETEPAITKHLAAFLTRAGEAAGVGMWRPDAVLFNGGFFTPQVARDRVLDALAEWFGSRPAVLENERPEAAVAVGAAFYGRLRQDPAASGRLLIRAGSARSYYVGVEAEAAAGSTTAVCVLPRGTEEGTSFTIDRQFVIQTNRPAAFTLYSSRFRTDAVSSVVTFADGDDVVTHAPLVTTLRFGKRSRSVPLPVRLSTTFTETGTLELWCASTTTEHRWRLAFNLRAGEADPLEHADVDADVDADGAAIVVSDDAVAAAASLLREAFGAAAFRGAPQAVVGDLENALGHGKADWPLPALRRLADVLIECERGRTKGAAFEVRWLNLVGFCLRPGFGSASDDWRVSELRKVYAAGLAFPKEIQNQVEWIVLWSRVGGGFNAGQQRELAQRTAAQLGMGGRKPPRLNLQIERESWRLLASLERLDAAQKVRFGDELLARAAREPRNTTWSWALGRLGARAPLYGPLNTVVPPTVAARWIESLLAMKEITPDGAAAIAQIGARTGDPARDISDATAEATAARLRALDFTTQAHRLEAVQPADVSETTRTFGESLPHGLRLSSEH
jgi:molecular chaperone DnaK (HSP70)